MFKLDLEKAEEPDIKLPTSNIHWIIDNRVPEKHSALLTMLCCVDHNKLWKILKEMEIPDHLICLLRNLYAGQEATVRTGHGQFSFQSQRKAMPKNVQTTEQLHSSHMLAKLCSKFSKPGFNSM